MTRAVITFSPAAVMRMLLALIILLALAHVAVSLIRNVAGFRTMYGLVPLFDLNSEQGIPTYFAATLHLLSSALLTMIAVMKKRTRTGLARQWALLAATFLYMAIDEACGLHELAERPMRELLGERATGVLHFAWVLPGIAIAAVVALFFVKWFIHLRGPIRLLVASAAALFVSGALGVEVLEGNHAATHGSENLTFDLYVVLEESLEMAGVAVFVYAMLIYVKENYREVAFDVADPEPARTGAPRPL